ncbi:ABC transporter permease [Mediterraneibacter glycyrrhizinilyticus]|nr:ABC transporter permease [Mediterraneibacter glycyrrhizinilyticus]MBM6852838.1 ABC transporter permease [Mediterraneibacter glycyrrhizinilyticus]
MLDMIRYSFLTKIKKRDLVFWPLIFPFVLGTAMYFSIGQMEEADFETVRAALVREAEQGNVEGEDSGKEIFPIFLESLEEDSDLILTEEMTGQEAEEALENGEIDGIYYDGTDPSLTVSASGFPQSILQMVLESYMEGKETLEDVAALHPEGFAAAVRSMEDHGDVVEQVSLGGKTTDGTAQLFYALLGMACLYGCFIGYSSAMEIQANLSPLAARRCAGPVHRLSLVVTEILVSFGIHFVNMLLLLAYMKFVLKLEFAGSYVEMLPVVLMGSMIGVTMGMFITSVGKMGEGVKIGIMVGASMALSFCAGLMNPDIKNAVDRSIPLLNRVNPAALISDALYCLNVYDAPERYAQDMMILAGLCVLLTAGTFLIIRRERYVSI